MEGEYVPTCSLHEEQVLSARAPEYHGGDSAKFHTGLLVLGFFHVFDASLNVLEDRHTIKDDVVSSIDNQLFWVQESLAHVRQCLQVLVAKGSAVFHDKTDL